MKNIEHVYPIAHRHTAEFSAQRSRPLTHDERVTAYMCFLDLEYNDPRPLTLRCLVNRYEDEEGFSAAIAAEVVEYWRRDIIAI